MQSNGESKAAKNQADHFIGVTGRVMCLSGGALLLLTLTAFIGTAIYEWLVPPTDMHLLGLLTSVLMFYVAPVGAVLLLLGCLLWISISFVGRKS